MTLREKIQLVQEHFGLQSQQLARELGITAEWMSKITNGKRAGSPDIGLRLDEFLRKRGIEPSRMWDLSSVQVSEERFSVRESPGETGKTAEKHAIAAHLANSLQTGPIKRAPTMQLNPRFQPAEAHPTPEDCIAYFTEYVNRAAREAGGVGLCVPSSEETLPPRRVRIRRESSKRKMKGRGLVPRYIQMAMLSKGSAVATSADVISPPTIAFVLRVLSGVAVVAAVGVALLEQNLMLACMLLGSAIGAAAWAEIIVQTHRAAYFAEMQFRVLQGEADRLP